MTNTTNAIPTPKLIEVAPSPTGNSILDPIAQINHWQNDSSSTLRHANIEIALEKIHAQITQTGFRETLKQAGQTELLPEQLETIAGGIMELVTSVYNTNKKGIPDADPIQEQSKAGIKGTESALDIVSELARDFRNAVDVQKSTNPNSTSKIEELMRFLTGVYLSKEIQHISTPSDKRIERDIDSLNEYRVLEMLGGEYDLTKLRLRIPPTQKFRDIPIFFYTKDAKNPSIVNSAEGLNWRLKLLSPHQNKPTTVELFRLMFSDPTLGTKLEDKWGEIDRDSQMFLRNLKSAATRNVYDHKLPSNTPPTDQDKLYNEAAARLKKIFADSKIIQ